MAAWLAVALVLSLAAPPFTGGASGPHQSVAAQQPTWIHLAGVAHLDKPPAAPYQLLLSESSAHLSIP